MFYGSIHREQVEHVYGLQVHSVFTTVALVGLITTVIAEVTHLGVLHTHIIVAQERTLWTQGMGLCNGNQTKFHDHKSALKKGGQIKKRKFRRSTRQGAVGEIDVINGNVSRCVKGPRGFKEDGEVLWDSTNRHLTALPQSSTVTGQPPQCGGPGALLQQHIQLLCVWNSV